MKISTKGRYGLRALIDLAQYSEIEPVSISSIATRQGISERYLEQLMTLLKKAQLIKSIRGAGGGYVLAKDMNEISVPLFFSTVANECLAAYVENAGIPKSVASAFIAALHEEITFRTSRDTSNGVSLPFA